MLDSSPEIRVVACSTGLTEAISLVREHEPGLVVVDWDVEQGLQRAVTFLRNLPHAPPVLVMGIDGNAAYHAAARQAGACGYVVKDSDLSDWLSAIRNCAGWAVGSP